MRKRLWDLAKSRIEIATILPGHRHKVCSSAVLSAVMGTWEICARKLIKAAKTNKKLCRARRAAGGVM